MDMLQQLRDWFWCERFWLPPDLTWDHLKSNEHARFPETRDLYCVVPVTFFLILTRLFFERFIASPLLKWCGLKEKTVVKVEPNELLEKVYSNLTGQLGGNEVKSLASSLGWTVKRVEQWFRNKRNHSKLSKLDKSKECWHFKMSTEILFGLANYAKSIKHWRCFFYATSYILGVSVLRKEEYLNDTKHFWLGYPNHELADGVYYYYVLQCAFYSALLLSQFVDVKRKDFWIQTVHHIVTIALLLFSYSCNFVRVGAIILLVHDVADIILDGGKIVKYLNLQKLCDVIFGIFSLVFFLSRIVIYPMWILRSVCMEFTIYIKPMPMYYCFVILLFTLQAMHLFWFYLIVRMTYNFLVKGKVDNDARSESEDSENDKEVQDNGVVKNGIINDKPKIQ